MQIVTFRLTDSLPRAVYEEISRDPDDLRRRRRFDETLDGGRGGCQLGDPEAAALVAQALKHFDGERYRLFAWVVMPNHVHALFDPQDGWSVSLIVANWKSYTARAINHRNSTSGRVWAPDYFDRYVRNQAHFALACDHIEQNPVKAGLAPQPGAWPFSSARRE